jgi:hypothetical protein
MMLSTANTEEKDMQVRPKVGVLKSEDCLMLCSDGKRRVGHYHCNGHWYQHTDYLSRRLPDSVDVLEWEYLNQPSEE